ncbi:MAG: hypothetical protein PHV05_05355, partial [Candidatus Riflebacteria bacterium]|nr:hypothetical protein [Candidatus Riflebacteria bacterium]
MNKITNAFNSNSAVFANLSDTERMLCSIQALHVGELDVYQFEWLLKKLCRALAISCSFNHEKLLAILTSLADRGIFETQRGASVFVLSQNFFRVAFRYPLVEGFHKNLAMTMKVFTTSSEFAFMSQYSSRETRELLLNVYLGCFILDEAESYSYLEHMKPEMVPMTVAILEPFNESWFQRLPESSQIFMFREAHYYNLFTFDRIVNEQNSDIFRYFKQPGWFKSEIFLRHGAHIMAEHLILCGQFDRARSYIECSISPEAGGLRGLLLYLFHGHSAALPVFRDSLKVLRKEKGKRFVTFQTLADPFYFISLTQEGSRESLQEAGQYSERLEKIRVLFRPFYWYLLELYQVRISGKINEDKILACITNSKCPLNSWLGCFAMHWLGRAEVKSLIQLLDKTIEAAAANDFLWPAYEGLQLKSRIGMQLSEGEHEFLDEWQKNLLLPLADRVEQLSPWETVLEAINSTLNLSDSYEEGNSRLIWELSLSLPRHFSLHAREQAKLKSGRWSVGKIIDSDRYYDGLRPYPDFYTQHDQNIFQAMRAVRPWATRDEDWRVFLALVGHPRVFFTDAPQRSIEILRGEPVLLLSETGKNLQLVFQPPCTGQRITIIQETDFRLRVFEFTEIQLKVAKIIENHAKFPPAALNKLKTTIAGLSPLMPVHTSVEGTENLTPIASISADASIYAQLEPFGDGLKIRLCVKPFGEKGPNFLPGLGMQDVFAEISGQKLHTKRNFKEEKTSAEELILKCPSIEGLEKADFCGEFVAADDSLQLLLELQQVEKLCIEWPENHKKTKVTAAKFDNFKFKIAGNHDWFELEGE